jgi:hypothetical protein
MHAEIESLTLPHKARSRKPVPAPSFRRHMDHRIRHQRAAEAHGATCVSSYLRIKPQRDSLLAELGHPLPAKLLVDGSIDDVKPLLAEYDALVLKPVVGSASTGVFLLQRTPSGWRDLRRETVHSDVGILQKLAGQTIRGEVVERWSAEQLVTGPGGRHPVDWKVYMFGDQCGLVLQKMHLPDAVTFRWWGPDWQPVDVGKYTAKIDKRLRAPRDPSRVLELAASVSRSLPMPFIRVDLIEGADGYCLSEVAPTPGTYHRFFSEWDARLGMLWEAAELAWGHRFLVDDQFQPALRIMRSDVEPLRLIPN